MNTITLATLHEATAQEVFDQAARHLLTQGQQSLSAYGICVYRNNGGLKCVVGCFISDDEYNPAFEGRLWEVLAEEEEVPFAHSFLLANLQDIHDSDPASWMHRLAMRTM